MAFVVQLINALKGTMLSTFQNHVLKHVQLAIMSTFQGRHVILVWEGAWLVQLLQAAQHAILLYQYGVIIDAMYSAPQKIDFMDLPDALIIV